MTYRGYDIRQFNGAGSYQVTDPGNPDIVHKRGLANEREAMDWIDKKCINDQFGQYCRPLS